MIFKLIRTLSLNSTRVLSESQKIIHPDTCKMPFYAVRVGKTPGIYTEWDIVKPLVVGFSHAEYKKFVTKSEASAYMRAAPTSQPPPPPPPPAHPVVKKEKFEPSYIPKTINDYNNTGNSNLQDFGGREFGKKRRTFQPPPKSAYGKHNKYEKPYDRYSEKYAPRSYARDSSTPSSHSNPSKPSKYPTDHNKNVINSLENQRLQTSHLKPNEHKFFQTAGYNNQSTDPVVPEAQQQAADFGLENQANNISEGYNNSSRTFSNSAIIPYDEPVSKISPRLTQTNANEPLIVYTDGSCRGNGKADSRAGIGVFFGDNDIRNVSERLNGKQTNNRAELSGVIRALEMVIKYDTDTKLAKVPRRVIIYTDSQYVINCMTKWLFNWAANGWKTSKGSSVQNKDLVEKIHDLILEREGQVIFKHVIAHSSVHGNEWADTLAARGANLPLES
ncbi:Ribonuclease H1 [Smittium culicis]|uniref:Ribonuclease H n=1 Tax=Smittium culicis TaxID=133412 RepID=A0A1R1WZ72_9FUNG|nr:Ribonuclease H1 [Smittium culicis]